MKARPILFSGPMVRALLAGTKTQTRRIVKPQPAPHESWDWSWPVLRPGVTPGTRICWRDDVRAPNLYPYCPYGVSRDLLWVRESWCAAGTPSGFAFMADHPLGADPRGLGWKPSIHMPRVASRLTLEITDVRVERLQEISEEDAKAEGITEHPCTGPHRGPDATYWTADGPHPDAPVKRTTPVSAYQALWEEINGDESWAANPWVWSVSFKVHALNVDALLQARGGPNG